MARKFSRDHHYIPKGILGNFCFQSRTTYFFDKSRSDKGIQRRNISTIFYQPHSNSFRTVDGKRDDEDERVLAAEIDNKIAPLVRGISENPSSFIDEGGKDLLARYLCAQVSRNPGLRRLVFRELEIPRVIDDGLRKQGLTEASILAHLGNSAPPQELQEFLFSRLASTFDHEYLGVFSRCAVAFAEPEFGSSFIIGDAPVLVLSNAASESHGEFSEYWIVLSPSLAMAFVEVPGESLNIQINARFSVEVVAEFNRMIADRSTYIAAKDCRTLEAALSL